MATPPDSQPLEPELTRIRQAIDDEDFATVRTLLGTLSDEAYHVVIDQLQAEGFIGEEPALEDVIGNFEPLLATIVAVAHGNITLRPAAEAELAEMETLGWMLSTPVRQIWAGERQRAALIAGLESPDAAIISHILTLLAGAKEPPA